MWLVFAIVWRVQRLHIGIWSPQFADTVPRQLHLAIWDCGRFRMWIECGLILMGVLWPLGVFHWKLIVFLLRQNIYIIDRWIARQLRVVDIRSSKSLLLGLMVLAFNGVSLHYQIWVSLSIVKYFFGDLNKCDLNKMKFGYNCGILLFNMLLFYTIFFI